MLSPCAAFYQRPTPKDKESCLCNFQCDLSFSGIFLPVMVNTFLLENFTMKIILLALLIMTSGMILAQSDTSLINRLNAMLKFTQVRDLDKVMDYTYPKLFTIVAKDQLLQTMREAYETDEYIIELDSVAVKTIFPIFKINDTSYVKVKHTMLMRMKYKKPDDSAAKKSAGFLITLMETTYGKGNVRFDTVANSLNIFMEPDIVGVKPRTGVWTFANLDENNPAMLDILFSKQVQNKLKEFK